MTIYVNVKDFSDLKQLPVSYFLEFLKDYGFKLDETKSSRLYPVMKNKDTGERLVIKRNGNGDCVFFSTKKYSGTIIDFLKYNGMSLKEISDKYLNKDFSVNEVSVLEKKKTEYQDYLFKDKYQKYRSAMYSNSLDDIGISRQNFNKLVNKEGLKQSSFSLVFPFYRVRNNDLEICGIYHYKFEKTKDNELKKVFEKNSQRALGILTENMNNRYAMVCEQPMDAISHRELMMKANKSVEKVSYIFSGGAVGGNFLEELDKFIESKELQHLFIGFDNDKVGKEYTQKVIELCERKGCAYSVKTPIYKDWQDDLTGKNIKETVEKSNISLSAYSSTLSGDKDKHKLKFLLECSGDREIRLKSVLKLNDTDILEKAKSKEPDQWVKAGITERLLQLQAAVSDKKKLPNYSYIENCYDFEKLKDFALHDKDPLARLTAVYRLDDDKTLTQVVLNEKDNSFHLASLALSKIDNKDYLKQISRKSTLPQIKEEADKQLKEVQKKLERYEDYER